MRKYLQPSIALEANPVVPTERFVFLGGTCNGSTWRERLIPQIKGWTVFNPIVENWTEADRANEERAKKEADVLLYVLTAKQAGFYSLVEATVSALHNTNSHVILVFMEDDDGARYSEADWKSIMASVKLLSENVDDANVKVCDNLDTAIAYINGIYE